MNDPMLPLSGLSPVAGKKVVVNFDGGLLSSDGGILVLREVEQRLRVADRMLEAHGVRNFVIDPASVQVDRRARRVKTDNIDVGRLLRSTDGVSAWRAESV